MLLVERGSELADLSCRVCHAPLRPGECVLVAYRRGKPSAIHAHLCQAPCDPVLPASSRPATS